MMTPLSFEQASQMARHLAQRFCAHRSPWLLDADDLYQVGMCGWCKGNQQAAAIYGAMVDALRSTLGRDNGRRIRQPLLYEQAVLTAFLIDHNTPETALQVKEFYRSLPVRLQYIAARLSEGYTEKEIGTVLQRSEARISQLRKELQRAHAEQSVR
jgi:hypothetical protein